MTATDEIKSRLDIVDIVTETVQLRRSGKSYTGFCPFHSNTRTPAFVVFPETGTWRCFGQCNEGGDIFRFVMKKEGWDFNQTLHYLAERAGVQLTPPTPQRQAEVEQHERLRNLLEEAVAFFRHNLINTPNGALALEYLHRRGLKDEILEAFGIGYAPDAWEASLDYFRHKNYSINELIEGGLVTEREGGGVYDRFRHRIIFPIRDERGRITGFGGRVLNPEDQPKFINSPQTVLFDKGHLLYGLERARRTIRTLDQAVIVEGYLDVIALHQAGFSNAISPMGTALSEQQLRLLKRFTRRIILALDSDAAGSKATLRGLQIARQALDRESEPIFDARGLLGSEARLQADIRVTTLPEGNDPDDVVMRDPEEWKRLVDEARPVVIHVMETLAAGQNLDDAKIKSQIANQVLPLIEDVPDSFERETYRQRLARLLRVDERALVTEARARPSRPRRGKPAPAQEAGEAIAIQTNQVASAYALAKHCLGILLRRPDFVFRIDRELQQDKLPRLAREDFERYEHQAIYHLIQESLEQDLSEPQNYVFNHLDLVLMDEADMLLVGTENFDMNEDRIFEDLRRGILKIRERQVHLNIDNLRNLMLDTGQTDSISIQDYMQYMRTNVDALKHIHHALGRSPQRKPAMH